LLQKPIEDLCQGATGLIKGIGKKWQAAGIADSIVQRVEDLERVRTMFSNEPVALSSFYYPSKVHSAQHARSPMSVNSLTDLNKDGNVLIAGTLGQGKSMFMRHLCVQEAKTASSVPLFIELRGIDGENGIDSLLRNALQLLGFTDIDGTILAFLFLSGRFVVFADGYDEVKREFALQTQHDMTLLMNQYPATRWIVSTRPGSLADHLQTVPNLRHYYLTPLTEDDFSPFLENLKIPAEQRLRLLSEIKGSQTQVKGVLTTPLMLTLLVETFGSGARIPNNLHDFYVSIFIVLVWRHDNLKPMFQRQRATSLSNGDLQDVFEAFAFLTKEFGVSLNDEQFAEASKNAARICNKEFHPEGLKNDLTDAVCLMMRDGLKTAFIHRAFKSFLRHFSSSIKAITKSLKRFIQD
jgi:hypothetical protein